MVGLSNYTVLPYADCRAVELCDPQQLDLAGLVHECMKGCSSSFKFTKSVAIMSFRLQLNELMSLGFVEDLIPLHRAVQTNRQTWFLGRCGLLIDRVMFTENKWRRHARRSANTRGTVATKGYHIRERTVIIMILMIMIMMMVVMIELLLLLLMITILIVIIKIIKTIKIMLHIIRKYRII